MRAATLWRIVLAGEFAVAVGIAASLWIPGRLSAPAALAAAIGVFLLIACPLVAAPAIAGRARGGEAAGPARWFAAARMIAHETLHFTCAQIAMSVQSGRRAGGQTGPAPARKSPILLVHGLACNRGVWWMLRRRLRDAGFGCVHAIDLEPLDADLDQLAGTLKHEVERLRRAYAGERLTIVAHSMGGLVARAMLRLTDPAPVHHLITLATPHGGAVLARALDWPCAVQMRPASEWLARLDAHFTDAPAPPRTTCFYSLDDNLVAPARSAALPGAAHVAVSGLGHFGLLTSGRVGNLVIGTLREAA